MDAIVGVRDGHSSSLSVVSGQREGGEGLLWSDQPGEDVGQRQGDRVVALHHHEPLPGHHDHLQLPLSLPGETDLRWDRK